MGGVVFHLIYIVLFWFWSVPLIVKGLQSLFIINYKTFFSLSFYLSHLFMIVLTCESFRYLWLNSRFYLL